MSYVRTDKADAEECGKLVLWALVDKMKEVLLGEGKESESDNGHEAARQQKWHVQRSEPVYGQAHEVEVLDGDYRDGDRNTSRMSW
jgi:hypothetical protein